MSIKGYDMAVMQYIKEGKDDESESKRYNQILVLPIYCLEHYG